MNKKLLMLFSITFVVIGVVVAGTTIDSKIRTIGAQYMPWDTDRMVKNHEMIFSGTITNITPVIETEIEYYDGTTEILNKKKIPYQYVTVNVDQWIKGDNSTKTITYKDVANSVVIEGNTLISVVHENVPTYEIGEKGTFFVELLDGELIIDGYYSFLKEGTDDVKSSDFLKKTGEIAPTDSELIDKVAQLNQ